MYHMMGILVAILKFCLPQWLLEIWNKIVKTTGGSAIKNPPADAGDLDSIPVLGRSHGEGNGNPCQYSCQENPMDRGAWQAMVHRAAKSRTGLSTHYVLNSALRQQWNAALPVFFVAPEYFCVEKPAHLWDQKKKRFSCKIHQCMLKWVNQSSVRKSPYRFPRVAIRNDHKLDGLKQQKSILSQFWRLEVWNQGVGRSVPSGGSEEECVPMPLF